jgi:hypothetical protein
VAVPVYGCGFIQDNSAWAGELKKMSDGRRGRWLRLLEPSSYLSEATCPMLFVNGSSDTHFSPERTSRSALLVRENLRHVAFIDGLRHGHNWKIAEVDAFVQAVMDAGGLPVRFSRPSIMDGAMTAALAGDAAGCTAIFYYSSQKTLWKDRAWKQIPAAINHGEISAKLPRGDDLICYFSIIGTNGCVSTSLCASAGAAGK